MKYEVLTGFDTKDERFEAGDIIEEKNIPSKSKGWLLKSNIIIKCDAKYQEKKLAELNAKKQEEEQCLKRKHLQEEEAEGIDEEVDTNGFYTRKRQRSLFR